MRKQIAEATEMPRKPNALRGPLAALFKWGYGTEPKDFAEYFSCRRKTCQEWYSGAVEQYEKLHGITRADIDPYIVKCEYVLTSFERLHKELEKACRAAQLEEVVDYNLRKRKSRYPAPRIYTIPWPRPEDDGECWHKYIKPWAMIVAALLIPALRKAPTISISWARHLKAIVDGVERLSKRCDDVDSLAQWLKTLPSPNRCTVFPFLGDPSTLMDDEHGWKGAELAPSSLVRQLAAALRRFGIPEENLTCRSMPGAVGFIPFEGSVWRGFGDSEAKKLSEFVLQSDGYKNIFVPPPSTGSTHRSRSLADDVKLLLLAIGSYEKQSNFWIKEFYERGNVPLEYFKNCVGDCGGLLMATDGNDEDDPGIKKINERVIGMTSGQVLNCAESSRELKDGLGTVVFCTEAVRANALIAAMQRGWVNTAYICDRVEGMLRRKWPADLSQ